jgi:hypothetical protein
MMDLEREQLRKTYEVSRMGFGILAAALLLACLDSLLPILRNFYPELYLRIVSTKWFRWIDVPITWGCLLGVSLLWGRFEHPGWQRRVGLLLFMNVVDVGLWFLDHGVALGLAEGDFGHEWLRINVGQALGWAEFALVAGLSCEYLEHLGVEYARESGKSTRSMAATGAVVWLLLFCQRTSWSAGWPLAPHPIRSIEEFLLYQASILIWAITLMQVTSLAISASKMSGQVLLEMQIEDEANDPFVTVGSAAVGSRPVGSGQ